jgi:hypothetical protein
MNKNCFLLLGIFLLFSENFLQATRPDRWTISTQAQFLEGELNGVSVTSDGKLVLAPALKLITDTGEAYIYATIVDRTGDLYLGSGNNGKIFRITPAGEQTLWTTMDRPGVYALAVDSQNQIYAANGPNAKVYRLNGQGQPKLFFDPQQHYIWSLLVDKANNLLVGTGPNGVIYKVTPEGHSEVFYDSKESHIITLEWDLEDNLLAGTAPGGLLLRITQDGSPFVLYDSPLSEIKTIALDRYGNIYFAALATPNNMQTSSILTNSAAETTTDLETIGKEHSANTMKVYKLDKENLVETLYSSNHQIGFDLLVRSNGNLLLATGNKGQIISIDPLKRLTHLSQTSHEQITQLLENNNTIYVTTSNLGTLLQLQSQPSENGVYLSKVFDAGMLTRWGMIKWQISDPGPSPLKVYTRSGNTEVPDETWQDWSNPYTNANGDHVTSRPARFLQWKIGFSENQLGTALSTLQNAVDLVTVSYMQYNMAPRLTSLTINPPGVAFSPNLSAGTSGGLVPGGPDRVHFRSLPPSIRSLDTPTTTSPRKLYIPGARTISWSANDPNSDDLSYSIYYRDQKGKTWKTLKRGLFETYYTIDGVSLPDGSYQIKVVVTDAPSNPTNEARKNEMVSKPFVITNSTPVVILNSTYIEGRSISLPFVAKTHGSTIYQAEYAVNAGDWHIVFPEDGIADSESEHFTLILNNLKKGEHAIAVRIVDSIGNITTTKKNVLIN